MSSTSILIISPSKEFFSRTSSLLLDKWPESYHFKHLESLSDEAPDTDIALLDQDALPENGIDFLATASFKLSPRPIVLLMNNEPEDEKAFRTVKSLMSDFLVKKNLRSSGLYNTLRYTLETSELKLKLEQEQKRYSSLFYNSVEPAFFLRKDLSIAGANDAFKNTFGVGDRELMETPFVNFLEIDSERQMLKKNIAANSSQSIDVQVRFCGPSSKNNFLGRLKISPIRNTSINDGVLETETTSYHGTLTNISHEERLRAVKEKSDKIAMTYRLARNMAHEIRNPLTNVNLAIDQLKVETADLEDAQIYFDIIQRCTARIDGILTQLLTSSEKQTSQKITINAVELAKEVVDAMRDRSVLEEVTITEQYALEDIKILGDPNKLKIAFTNLFTNALESMDKDDQWIECHVSLDNSYFRLDVKDNGKGMDEDELETLFDPFFTSKVNGVGLGLTSTQTIVSEHDGEIQVESQKGKGSTFSVFLPLAIA